MKNAVPHRLVALLGVLALGASACGDGNAAAEEQANSDAADAAIARALAEDAPPVSNPVEIADGDLIDVDIDWFSCDEATFAGQPVADVLNDLSVGEELSAPPSLTDFDSAASCSLVTSDLNPVTLSMNWNEFKVGVEQTQANIASVKEQFGQEVPSFQEVTIGGYPATYYTDPNFNAGQWSLSGVAGLPDVDIVMTVQTGDTQPTQAQISAVLALLEAAAANYV